MDKTAYIGKFRIIRKIAVGGEGTVYLAEDEKLHQLNAVKFAFGNKDCRKRQALREEAARLASLSDRHLPYLVDIAEGFDYTAEIMEYVEGDTLSEYLKARFPLKGDDVLRLMMDVTDLIAYLHESRPPIIYRDIKPDNFIVTKDGCIRLVDMGTALFGYGSAEAEVMSGTPGYAAPEQFASRSIGREADVYALGMLYAYMLTGMDPIRDGKDKCLNACSVVAGKETFRLIRKCTADSAAERFSNAKELMDNLKRLQEKRIFISFITSMGTLLSNVLIWGSIADMTVTGLKAGGVTLYEGIKGILNIYGCFEKFYSTELLEYHIFISSFIVLVTLIIKNVVSNVAGKQEFIISYDWNELYTEKERKFTKVLSSKI